MNWGELGYQRLFLLSRLVFLHYEAQTFLDDYRFCRPLHDDPHQVRTGAAGPLSWQGWPASSSTSPSLPSLGPTVASETSDEPTGLIPYIICITYI